MASLPASMVHPPGRIAVLRVGRAGERLVAWSLALVLLRSAFGHLGNPFYFLSTVYSYGLTDVVWGQVVALALPHAQLVVAACLLTRRGLAEAYLLGLMIFAVFLVAQALALGRGSAIACGCFGPGEDSPIGALSLFIASSGIVLSLAGWLYTTVWEQRTGRL